jgi:GDP-L-fucose synthase
MPMKQKHTENKETILVTGGAGMVGTAIKQFLPDAIFLSSKDGDLVSYQQCFHIFDKYKPTKVIHLAAKVGGVKSNTEFVADFYRDNILINTNVLDCALLFGCETVVSLLSTCIYPAAEYVNYPLTEDQLHMGPPHESNYGYAHAKRMIEVQSRAYNQQYNTTKFLCAVPNNIFGINDTFDLENGHVVPSVIRKIYESVYLEREAIFWGDGSPKREFTSSTDIARALVFMARNHEFMPPIMNIGNTKEHTIKNLVHLVCLAYKKPVQTVKWDKTKPAGQYKKPSSNELWLKTYKELTDEDFTYEKFETKLFEVCEWFERNCHKKGRIRGLSK